MAHLRGDGHQRGAVGGGVGDAELHVDRAGPQGGRHHRRPARDPPIHLGHKGGGLLVPGEHVADAGGRQRLHESDVLLAGQPEHDGNTLVFQALDDQLSGFAHPTPPVGHSSGRLGWWLFTPTTRAEDVSVPIATINPATGETVKTFTPATDQEVDAAIARAYERFLDYRHNTAFAQRAQWANATADLLEAEADEVAAMMTLEMGKTLKSAKAEALKCAKGFRYYAENAEQLLADEPAEASKVGAKRAYTRWQPLGVVLAVMPWNFPLWQAVRFAAPALMAGNVGLLKHASRSEE